MAYSRDLFDSARRHLQAGELLKATDRRDVAGYLYGIAAECALKELMRRSGMRPLVARQEDPFYAHFPHIKTLLRDSAAGRRQGALRTYANDARFMQNWDVAMRYAPRQDIKQQDVDRWHEQATTIVNALLE